MGFSESVKRKTINRSRNQEHAAKERLNAKGGSKKSRSGGDGSVTAEWRPARLRSSSIFSRRPVHLSFHFPTTSGGCIGCMTGWNLSNRVWPPLEKKKTGG